MKSENQKIKILRILEILKDTSEDKPISTKEIIARLKEQNIQCGRGALYSDIALLLNFGYAICTRAGAHNQNLYYMDEDEFGVEDIRILYDMVQSAKFLTKEASRELADKVSQYAGSARAEVIANSTVFYDAVKHRNDQVLKTVRAIHAAIVNGKKVSFLTSYLGIDGNRIINENKERVTVNPNGLFFCNGYYYLGCHFDDGIYYNYRVDGLLDAKVEDKEKITYGSDYETFIQQAIASDMFSDKPTEKLTLLVRNNYVNHIFDKFGTRIKTKKIDEDHLTVTVDAQITPTLLYWCAMFDNNITIQSPQSAIDELVAMLSKNLEQYK